MLLGSTCIWIMIHAVTFAPVFFLSLLWLHCSPSRIRARVLEFMRCGRSRCYNIWRPIFPNYHPLVQPVFCVISELNINLNNQTRKVNNGCRDILDLSRLLVDFYYIHVSHTALVLLQSTPVRYVNTILNITYVSYSCFLSIHSRTDKCRSWYHPDRFHHLDTGRLRSHLRLQQRTPMFYLLPGTIMLCMYILSLALTIMLFYV